MVAILVCRVAWMPRYESDEEERFGGGSYVDQGNVPHESLNFLPVGDTYYGFVETGKNGKGENGKIELKNLEGKPGDKTVAGVLVVFCAKERETGELLVTGWYRHATVYRQQIERPGDNLGRKVSFTAKDATLVPESERCFRIPQARSGRPGGIGQKQFWYGLNEEKARTLRELLDTYIDAPDLIRTPQEAVESRQRRRSERLERHGTYRQFINVKGYRCEACGWSIDEDEREVWGSSFELHHLAPIRELPEKITRAVRIEDFAVLCASCHRAIHRTEFVSDVAGFSKAYPRTRRRIADLAASPRKAAAI